ncbi:MAG: glycosyltransferase family 9 protein [Tunicatimonas sp.]
MQVNQALIIQTAFIGDVILTTPLIENLHEHYPEAFIDVLVNQDTASLLHNHPKVRHVYAWNKKKRKYAALLALVKTVRRNRYDLLINCHRFASSGLVAAGSGAKLRVGFRKNPFSFTYDVSVSHTFAAGTHEVDRNLSLLTASVVRKPPEKLRRRPQLYPTAADRQCVRTYQQQPYVCVAPTSVWFTKQLPAAQWSKLIDALPAETLVYLLGSKQDAEHCAQLQRSTHRPVVNLAGKLSLLQSAELMRGAVINYVNDSAPLHLASATNAPVCAVYCSTVPRFGFYPLSDASWTVEVAEPLSCRPCGLHGHAACPEGHFRCARDITTQQLLHSYHQALARV